MSVAVKVIARGEITPQQRSGIVNEVASLQTLMHPNLVRVLGVTEQPARHVSLVAEWLHGGTLADFLRRDPCANEQHRLDIFINVCSAGATFHFDRDSLLSDRVTFLSHQSLASTPTPAALQATG
jgi:serine/threonine protein kinase